MATAVPRSPATPPATVTPVSRGVTAANSVATALDATAQQLALGNDQWIELRMKVRDLIRVGTDPSRTLGNIDAVEVLVSLANTTDTVTVQYDSLFLVGGYGPDAGVTGQPYVYAGRYRSTVTGVIGNPSPPSRGSVVPRRQYVDVSIPASADAQVDQVDYFRFGGALTTWQYAGSAPNGHTFRDAVSDSQIEGGEILAFNRFQPWPILDLPRSGTCDVAGTAVRWVSGDQFNPKWAPGSLVVINGVATTLYASPQSTTQLQVVENLGSGSGVSFSIVGATVLSQALPAAFGGMVQGVMYTFGVGDPNDPGMLHWTFGNDPDSTSDAFTISVAAPNEPLMNGCVADGQVFVFSSDNLFLVLTTNNPQVPFIPQITPCGRGLKYSRWAMCASPDGMYFLTDDGIGLTSGGPAVIVTDPDLRELFPHDGSLGKTVNGIDPPDMTQPQHLRLSWIDGMVYFDYRTVGGQARTLVGSPMLGASVYDRVNHRWFYDKYDRSGVTVRLGEPGNQVHTQMMGTEEGNLYLTDLNALTDNGTAISWVAWTSWEDAKEPRLEKQWGDGVVDLDPKGSVGGISIVPVVDGNTRSLPTQVKGAGATGRFPYIIDFGDPATQSGVIARNLGLQISGSVTGADTARPLVYLWEAAVVPKSENIAFRATDWADLGYPGAKFVQGIIIRANTYGIPKQIVIQRDGGATALTFPITHPGETEIAYPLSGAGWTPFVSQLVRLGGSDATPWQLLGVRWVFEPAPELATEWTTQFGSHDLPGYFQVRDGVVAISDQTAPVTLTITYVDGSVRVYTVPFTGPNYQRVYVPFEAHKGTAAFYSWRSTAPFRLYKKDCAIRIQGWGLPNGYQVLNPFGGPSRADGAAV